MIPLKYNYFKNSCVKTILEKNNWISFFFNFKLLLGKDDNGKKYFIKDIFFRNSNGSSENESPKKLDENLKRKNEESRTFEYTESPNKRRKHNSGHKTVFDSKWQYGRPWLKNIDDVMICQLCQKHSSVGVWSDTGCKTIRLDKIKEHEHCSEHLASVNRESEQENTDKCNQKINQNSRSAIKDALKVIYYLVEHNLSLDLFSSLVDLNIELGSCNLNNLKLAKNAKYTSWDIVSELLKLLSDEVRENLFNEMRKSPTYSLMVDEVMDITSHKHLAICARYIDTECNIKNAFICDPLIDDGRAETITDKIKEELQFAKLPLSKMSAFGSDGAAVLSGKKMVYGQN